MSISTTIQASFDRSFTLYRDLVDSLDETALSAKLPDLPSNTMGLQLWCVVGARESFAAAISANEWTGFACSLEEPTRKASVEDALQRSSRQVTEVLGKIDSFTDVQNRLILDLLEHEAAHHGQLIRYLYGLRLTIPESWRSRYALRPCE